VEFALLTASGQISDDASDYRTGTSCNAQSSQSASNSKSRLTICVVLRNRNKRTITTLRTAVAIQGTNGLLVRSTAVRTTYEDLVWAIHRTMLVGEKGRNQERAEASKPVILYWGAGGSGASLRGLFLKPGIAVAGVGSAVHRYLDLEAEAGW
jgi:hypothetical protein